MSPVLVIRERRHKMTWTMLVPRKGTEFPWIAKRAARFTDQVGEQVSPVLDIRERRHKMTWAMLVPRKGTEFPWIAKRAARFIDQLGGNRSVGKGNRTSPQEGCQTVPKRPPVGERKSNGIIEHAVELVAGQARTLKAALEHRFGTRIPPDANMLCWLVEFAAYLMNRCDFGSDGKTPLQRLHLRRDNTPILEFGQKILYMPAKPSRGGKWEPRFHPGAFMGMLNSSSEAVVVTEQGTAIREMGRRQNTRNASRPMVCGRQRQCIRHSSRNGRDRRRWCPRLQERC